MSIDRQEPLRNLATMVARIHGTSGTGRLAVRNTARMGTLHLYFELGRLVHLEGSRASVDDCLIDLTGWTDGLVRFDRGVHIERHTVTPEQEEFFRRTLLMMQQRGVVNVPSRPTNRFQAHPPPAGPPLPEMPPTRVPVMPAPPRRAPGFASPVIDADPTPREIRRATRPASPPPPARSYSGPLPPVPPAASPPRAVDVLLSSRQWELLIEVVRSMVEAVGHLFGLRQAQNILQHVLADRSEQAESLGLLQVDRQGWLRELRPGEMLTQPVQDVSEAFVLLISDFEQRCASLLGEEKTRQIIGRALQPYEDALAEIGIALNAS